jgi:DNA-binding HxlR family transcriptional regulator
MKTEKAEPLGFTESQCGAHLSATEDAFYVIGGKWTLRIMIAVLSGHHRFNDLQRSVSGISARVLSAELKDLELNGLVQRTVLADHKPVIVEYLPTPYSRSLKHIIAALAQWGADHKKKIMTKA